MEKCAWFVLLIGIVTHVSLGYNGEESEDYAGPYSTAMNNFNPTAQDAGIPGFIGPSGRGVCSPGENDEEPSGEETLNVVNPVFNQWASGYLNYIPAPAAITTYIGREIYAPYAGVPAIWRKPLATLGLVTGDNFDVCVLGDLFLEQIRILDPANAGYAANAALPFNSPYKIQPGQITLTFTSPIHDGPGPDFAVFENGFISAGGAGVAGQIFAELAYVEVSSNGITFVRFPNVSLTEPTTENGGTGAYGTIDPSQAYNLAGKHVNAYESSWGTPFNLSDLASDPNVLNGTVNLQNILYIRIIDIPGNGFFKDTASALIDPNTIDPNTGTGGTCYSQNNGIHDAWPTWGSGGHDLEAIGAIQQIYGDANSDGSVNLADFVKMASRWRKYGNWPQGDFNENRVVNTDDFQLFLSNWLAP